MREPAMIAMTTTSEVCAQLSFAEVKTSTEQRRGDPAQMKVKAKSRDRHYLLPGAPLMPLIFSAISMNRLKMPTA